MHGAEYLSDEEMLCRATTREEELERTVRELERSASELERERDAAYVWEDAYGELEELSTSIRRRNPLWRTGDSHRRQHTVHRT